MSRLQQTNAPYFFSMPLLRRKIFLKSWVSPSLELSGLPLNRPMATPPWREFKPFMINCAISPTVISLFLNLVEDLKICVTNSHPLVNLLMNQTRLIGFSVVLGLSLRPSLQLSAPPLFLLFFVIFWHRLRGMKCPSNRSMDPHPMLILLLNRTIITLHWRLLRLLFNHLVYRPHP